MIRRLLLISVVAAVLVAAGVAFRFTAWRALAVAELERGAVVIETERGPIELARFGTTDPAILVLHGTPGGYDQVADLSETAIERGFQLLAISRPGYLRTPISVGRTPADQADSYVALLDAIGIDRVAVIGISGGGPSALQFAIRHPDRCWALVDLMGVSRARLADEKHPRQESDSPIFEFLFGTDFGGWLLSGVLQRNPERMLKTVVSDAAIRDRILADSARRDRFVALANSALKLPERRNTGVANDIRQFESLDIPELERITAPTLILHGTADVNVPLAMGERVAQRVRNAKLVTFPGADHFMVVSHSEDVFGALFAFLVAHAPHLPPE